MPPELFSGINARQVWSNWRTIPRNLTGRLRNHRVKMVDLCCGIGDSTQVLAYYAPDGSEILGLEFNPGFVAHARSRRFANRRGRRLRVQFSAQSVLDIFRDATGARLPDGSVDVVNSCGAVACHFDLSATAVLAREIARVLKDDGFAMIDTGPGLRRSRKLIHVFEAAGFSAAHRVRSCFADRYTHVCFQKVKGAAVRT
jgi:SAM-dependent methyltransferase